MCEDFTPNIDDNAPSHTFSLTRNVLTKNNMTVVLHPPVSPAEDKIEKPAF
jgi:hypothetical protein